MRLRYLILCGATLPFALAGTTAIATTKVSVPSQAASSLQGDAAAKAAMIRAVEDIRIPVEQFTLPNGLKVVVITNKTTPKVLVSMYYRVGSKHEPKGRSGFAHLFEHLMFNGSENVPGDYLTPLQAVGAEVNGSTSQDRTNYYAIVPKGALDRALFMESDRMGHLLGALDQATLDEQRGVVLNEKRGASPSAVVSQKTMAALYPTGHPYGHSVIGSMRDIDAADLDDVRNWFKRYYGPNNAFLVLAGNVELAEAKRLVTKYFADIPAGPPIATPPAPLGTVARDIRDHATAPVSYTAIVRTWPVPGLDNDENFGLDIVMGALNNSTIPLQKHLVEEQKLFTSIRASNNSTGQVGEFQISATVAPGIDPKRAEAALDRELAAFLKNGAKAREVDRFVGSFVYKEVLGLELPASQGSAVGDAMLFTGDPMAYKRALNYYVRQTPASVSAIARKWLSRPSYQVLLTPGPRILPPEDVGIDGAPTDGTAGATTSPAVAPPAPTPRAVGDRGPLPPVAAASDSPFPPVQQAQLRNGMRVSYIYWPSGNYTNVSLSFPFGLKDALDAQLYPQSLMWSQLESGFAGHDEDWIRDHLSMRGMSLSAGTSEQSSSASLSTPDVNLDDGLTLLDQMLRQPTFPADALDRAKRQRIDWTNQTRLDPNVLVGQVLPPLLDAGAPRVRINRIEPDHAARTNAVTRADLLTAYRQTVRPDGVTVSVVSSRPLPEIVAALNRTVGTWQPTGAVPASAGPAYLRQSASPRIVLIDLPGAVQATIAGGQVVPIGENDPNEAVELANAVLAGTFASRVNMNLREEKHWSYGASGYFRQDINSSIYEVGTAVQQDKVGLAIAELMKEVRDIVGVRPITGAEFDRAKTSALGAIAYDNRYALMGAVENARRKKRAPDYPAHLVDRIQAVTIEQANAALREQLDPSKWVWVIVGNAGLIRPQLAGLGLPIEERSADTIIPK